MTVDGAQDIRIRDFEAGDAPVLSEMIAELGRDSGAAPGATATREALLRHALSDPPDFQACLAETAGRAVGYCLWNRIYSTWRGSPGLWIVDLHVRAEVRSRGLGPRLIRAALARQSGDTAFVMLDLHHGNARARAFYDRLGFRHAREDMRMVLDGTPFETFSAATSPQERNET
jgi:ribosomal protein S18 acetylase RimI-like enzyme